MQTKSIPLGLLFGILCFQLFAFADVSIKWVTGVYHFSQIIFFRSIVAILIVMLPLIKSKKYFVLKTFQWHHHIIRTVLSTLSFFFMVLALRYLYLADFAAMVFTMPFVVLILAAIFLKEQIKPTLLGAIIVGFIGTVIIAKPTSGEMNIGVLYVFLSILFGASVVVHNRLLTYTESTLSITFWMNVFCFVLCLPFLIWFWQTPSWLDFMFLILIGLCRVLASLSLTEGLKYAPASVISQMDYTSLLWSILFGYLIWGEIPSNQLYIGASLIILSGVYLAYRENLDDKGIKMPVLKHAFISTKKLAFSKKG